jgi:hypothetical protein
MSSCLGTLQDERPGSPDNPVAPGSCGDIAPGPSPIRRMTRLEYDNTIRDLLGDTSRPAQIFPPDEQAPVGFDNNAINLKVSPLLAEQYMKAAEQLAHTATENLPGLLACDPATNPGGEDGCARQFIQEFGRRAFRRPLATEEVDRYLAVYTAGKTSWDFRTGIELAMQTLLQAPHFLYRVEFGVQDDPSARALRVSSWEVASRLSYFLWNSMPDEELFAVAEADQLSSPDEVAAQARRMLDDPKAKDAIANFHTQWLRLGELGIMTKDTTIFPSYTPGLRDLLLAETMAFVNDVFFQGAGDLLTLLTAPYTLMNGTLADFYGESGPAGETFQRVDLDPAQRAGLLTQGSVLAMHAKSNQTSPVLRGKLIREQFLCQMLPPPPDDVDVTPPDLDPGLTTRERFSMHTAEACVGCHTLMDPIGFGFEHFDGIGLWRDTEGALPIDATGQVIDWDQPPDFDGVADLAQKLAASPQVQQCVVTQWFRFANGRNEVEGDECQLQALQNGFETSGMNMKELLVLMTQTDAFLYRSIEGGAP